MEVFSKSIRTIKKEEGKSNVKGGPNILED
jgi:hypothetical protein